MGLKATGPEMLVHYGIVQLLDAEADQEELARPGSKGGCNPGSREKEHEESAGGVWL